MSEEALPALHRRRWWAHPAWAFLLVIAAYASVALWQITLPGVYMDAVNPDYLVAKILNRKAEPIGAWVLSANYLAGQRLPVLIALYHGSLTFWAGLPFFWLFGTDVVGLRLTHAMFGLAVLGGAFAVLLRARAAAWLAAAACAALALDAAFSYAFRTQSYITLGSGAWLLAGLACLLHANDANTIHRARWWLLAGLFYGIAIFGYFVYAFFFPALVGALLARRGIGWAARLRGLVAWSSGLAVGLAGYWIGYGLIIRERGGLAGFWRFVQEQQTTLGVWKSALSPWDRVTYAWDLVESILHNWWHHYLIFSEAGRLPGATLKTALLVGVPLVLWLVAERRRTASAPLRIVLALVASFLAVALVFGNRLGGHHFVVILPLLYIALALSLRDALSGIRPRLRLWGAAVPLLLLVGLNVVGQAHEGAELARTRGVGLYSDAINRFAKDLDADPRKPFVYFPDWGLSMPVAFLTRGRVGMDTVENPQSARHMLCHGRNVAVALVGPDRDARFAQWQEKLAWSPPARTPYAQADGTVVFELGVFTADASAPSCTAKV